MTPTELQAADTALDEVLHPWKRVERLEAEIERLNMRLKQEQDLGDGFMDEAKAQFKAKREAERQLKDCREDRERTSDAAILAENTRLSAEWQQCHDWNNALVSEHYDLNAKIERLEKALRVARECLTEHADRYGADQHSDTCFCLWCEVRRSTAKAEAEIHKLLGEETPE